MILPALLLTAIIGADAGQSECSNSIAREVLAAPIKNGRVAVVFSGPQRSLLALDEHAAAFAESTLFPIHTKDFVLTVRLSAGQELRSKALPVAMGICQLGTASGGRFEGALAFVRETTVVGKRVLTRERMVDAAMAKLPSN